MSGSLIEALIEYGMAGLFIGFMVWQHVVNTKRSDAHLDKFESNLQKLRKENQKEIAEIRGRYDVVIAKYESERESQNKEREELRNQISEIINKNSDVLEKTSTTIDNLQDNFKELISSIESLVRANEGNQTVMTSMRSNLEDGVKVIKDLVSERRLIDAAKAAVIREKNEPDNA